MLDQFSSFCDYYFPRNSKMLRMLIKNPWVQLCFHSFMSRITTTTIRLHLLFPPAIKDISKSLSFLDLQSHRRLSSRLNSFAVGLWAMFSALSTAWSLRAMTTFFFATCQKYKNFFGFFLAESSSKCANPYFLKKSPFEFVLEKKAVKK